MKKLLALLLIFISGYVFAEERTLLSIDSNASINDYSFIDNFEITSNSGYYSKNQLIKLSPNENGLRFIAKDVPNSTSSYVIIPPYPTYLNEPNTNSGNLENVSTIKSIKITLTTNRPYDEFVLLYSTSYNGKIYEIKMPQDFNAVKSMEEFELIYDNPLYETNVAKRELKNLPVVNNEINNLYFRGIRVKTNIPSGYNEYSPYSIVYLKSISVIYDKAFTDEQFEQRKQLQSDFEIDEVKNTKEKELRKVDEKIRLQNIEKDKMD